MVQVPVCPRCESTDVKDVTLSSGQYGGTAEQQVCQDCGYGAPTFPIVAGDEAPETPLDEGEWHDVSVSESGPLMGTPDAPSAVSQLSQLFGPLGLFLTLLALIGGNPAARLFIAAYVLPLAAWATLYGWRYDLFKEHRLLWMSRWLALAYLLGGPIVLGRLGLV